MIDVQTQPRENRANRADETDHPGREQIDSRWSSSGTPEGRMAQGLGWFSIGLGALELAASGAISRWLGMSDGKGMIRMLGAREIASGIGILRHERPATWMWGRVAGDVMDLAVLGMALPSATHRRRLAGAATFVAGALVADYMCADRLSRLPGARSQSWMQGGSFLVHKAISIRSTPEDLYAFWRNFENLPRIMSHLDEVRVTGDRTSHWVARTAGMPIEWDAEIVNDERGRLIGWRSLPGSMIRHEGSVSFETARVTPETVVRVEMEVHVPGGGIAKQIAKVFGQAPGQVVMDDLRRLKQLVETGEIATTEGQPSGRSKEASESHREFHGSRSVPAMGNVTTR
jgi:uncharacterized membrane protein